MGRGVGVLLGCVMLLAAASTAVARNERDLTDEELRAEMARNEALAAYVARNGAPDVAETHFLSDVPPWDDHEVTLYYLDMRKEIGFARAWMLGRPIVEVQRYERPLTDEQIAALTPRAQRMRQESDATRIAQLGPAERAEESARRAEAAADRIDAAADGVERAANRAEAIAAKAESTFHHSLRK